MRLADGREASVVLGYAEARTALNDPRVSKDMLAALEADPEVVAGAARPSILSPHAERRPARPLAAPQTGGQGLRTHEGSDPRARSSPPSPMSCWTISTPWGPVPSLDLVEGYARPVAVLGHR